MRHNKVMKAVARKGLKVIYAAMREAAPYSADGRPRNPMGAIAPGAPMRHAGNQRDIGRQNHRVISSTGP